MNHSCDRVFIVGGGFSHYAGLPLTSEFTSALLAAHDPDKGRSGALVKHLKKFVDFVFGPIGNADEGDWPPLEDLFTCIDLAANTGHHLGARYSAAELRTVRRCLIVRIIRMLHNRLKRAAAKGSHDWKALNELLSNIDYASSAFLSMNWDEVIEFVLLSKSSHEKPRVEYGCAEIPAAVSEDGELVIAPTAKRSAPVRLAKIHGSVNWLYCDNCQRVFWLPPGHGIAISNQLLNDQEWKRVLPRESHTRRWKCPYCKSKRVPLSTRLATFSYRKALDFPMLQKSWFAAENLLREARTWAFIGYSLPAADYEFKYFLKRIQLSRRVQPQILLVTGGSKTEAEDTRRSYERFFGKRLEAGGSCFLRGLDKGSTESLLRC